MDSSLAIYVALVGVFVWMQYRQNRLEDKFDKLAEEIAELREGHRSVGDSVADPE